MWFLRIYSKRELLVDSKSVETVQRLTANSCKTLAFPSNFSGDTITLNVSGKWPWFLIQRVIEKISWAIGHSMSFSPEYSVPWQHEIMFSLSAYDAIEWCRSVWNSAKSWSHLNFQVCQQLIELCQTYISQKGWSFMSSGLAIQVKP